MHAHISAPTCDLTLGTSDHAQRRCTGHAAAGRHVLLNKVALNVGPRGVLSTCYSSGWPLQGPLHLSTVQATALPLGVPPGGTGRAQLRSSSRVEHTQSASCSAGLLLHLPMDRVTAITTTEIMTKADFSFEKWRNFI